MSPQITVLDTGGQYTHLIARKVRDLGVYAEVRASETPASELSGRKGIIISGGPSSVYEPSSPRIDPQTLEAGPAVLGICYGQQLIAHLLGGSVRKGDKGEYGLAHLNVTQPDTLLGGLDPVEQIWMSHRDLVETPPPGFAVLASTDTCAVAAIGDGARRIYGVQFHPEVVHTRRGVQVLTNFLFGICGCLQDWNPSSQVDEIEEQIRRTSAGRKVFFFVSGGVDSTVAYTLCLRALGPDRVYGIYVDTGLMRQGETEFVRRIFSTLGATAFHVESAAAQFLGALQGATEPEQKRHIIGEQFVQVQERILETEHFLDNEWILGQGTIYPDTIESGGTAKADLIKTHHNRVAGIQRLIEANRIVEPLTSFYKDEVRALGRQLGVPEELLERHPFPGPGLGIRCLCATENLPLERCGSGWILPVRSVGVQGDSRSYRHVLAFETGADAVEDAAQIINRLAAVNRAVACVASRAPFERLAVRPAYLTEDRLARLRAADAIVRRRSQESGFEREIWQFPVVLIPVGIPEHPDSIVLRPVHSVDGMTAQAVPVPPALLAQMAAELVALPGIAAVFRDLTHKPPGTIEWE
ncbi:MAG: glutamine-hydrolyzing GMP synthase [Bryobacteraceae bacterium]